MRALVTGGTGFVGSHLIETLVRSGVEVTALVRSPAKAEALGVAGVRWIRGDLGDPSPLAGEVPQLDAVFHVAGAVAARSEAEFAEINREGTRRLLAALSPTGARFVFVSSLAAAGPSRRGAPLAGDEPARPVTAYGRSKLAAEAVVQAGPLPWVIVRPPTVYGPRDREVLRVFQAARLGVAPLLGSGTQELSLVYGPDLADALVAAATAPAAQGRILYASHPEIVTSAHLVRTIGTSVGRSVRLLTIPEPIGRAVLHVTGAASRLTGRTTVLTPDKANEFFQEAWTCNPAGCTAATGWAARHDLIRGVAATAAWYRQAGWL